VNFHLTRETWWTFLAAYILQNLPDNNLAIMPGLSEFVYYMAGVVTAFLFGTNHTFLLMLKNGVENIPYADYADQLSF
jgi:hypothetical protein